MEHNFCLLIFVMTGFVFVSSRARVNEHYEKRSLNPRHSRACICRPMIRVHNDGTCRRGITKILQRISNLNPGGSFQTSRARDCAELRKKGHVKSGVYTIYPTGLSTTRPANVYCDMKTDGGGWTVFQRRLDGTVDFYRGWAEYMAGFGDPHGEHWLGNAVIHDLTKRHPSTLRVDLENWHSKKTYAHYKHFSVGNSGSKYRLLVSQYSGTAGDALKYQNGHPFSTMDADNDSWRRNCAVVFHGAWWYNACFRCSLNGRYYFTAASIPKADAIHWHHTIMAHNQQYSFRRSEMKVRPSNFKI